MTNKKSHWTLIREWIFKYLGTFFMEQKKSKWVMSLGRTSFIVLLILALYMWAPFLGVGSITIPADMLQLLMVIAAYNFGSKSVDVVKAYIESKKKKGEEEPVEE